MGWRRSPLDKCPVCGEGNRDGHLSHDPDKPGLLKCWRASTIPLPGWRDLGNNLYKQENDRADRQPPPRPAPRPSADPTYSLPLAPTSQRDAAYRALFDTLTLSGLHRNQIAARGISADRVALFGLPLATLSTGSRVGIAERIAERVGVLSGVPGFYLDDRGRWTLAGSPGLLLPVMDIARRIIASQVRTDKEDGGRFRWISSADRPGGIGPTAPAGYIAPLRQTAPARVWLTEGFFKALAIADQIEDPAIWLGGVSQYKAALDRLEEIEAVFGYRPEVWIAYDADFQEKKGVRRELYNALLWLRDQGWTARPVAWDRERGKGIDDALWGGMTRDEIRPLALDELLIELPPPRYPHAPISRHLRTFVTETAAPKTTAPPDLATSRAQTIEAIRAAYVAPLGTISIIASPTGAGKTFAACAQAPDKTGFVVREYDNAGEERRSDLARFSKIGAWYYGRQPSPDRLPENAPPSAMERSQTADCIEIDRAISALRAGHNPCAGCAFAPTEIPDLSERGFGCGYLRHRTDRRDRRSPHLLAVPDVGLSTDFLGSVESVVFDDIDDLIDRLTVQIEIAPVDVATWQAAEIDADTDAAEVSAFFLAIRSAFAASLTAAAVPIDHPIRDAARAALDVTEGLPRPLPWEAPRRSVDGVYTYPKAMIRDLALAFAHGYAVTISPETIRARIARLDVLDALRSVRVLVLDATADLTLWRSIFDGAPGVSLSIPHIDPRPPRIIQAVDLLWTADQIAEHKDAIKTFAAKEDALIFSHKKNAPGLGADGWFGRHERGLNAFSGSHTSTLIAGHYEPPRSAQTDTADAARAVCLALGRPDPTPPPLATLRPDGRAWIRYADQAGRMAGLKRRQSIHPDPLADRIARWRRTATIIQAANRLRADAPVYLLDGAPLFDHTGTPYPSTLTTARELLGVDLASPGNNLRELNQARADEAGDRIMRGIEILTAWEVSQDRPPSLREARRLMGKEGGVCKAETARRALTLLNEGKKEQYQDIGGVVEGVPHDSKNIYSSVGYTPDHSCNYLETLRTPVFLDFPTPPAPTIATPPPPSLPISPTTPSPTIATPPPWMDADDIASPSAQAGAQICAPSPSPIALVYAAYDAAYLDRALSGSPNRVDTIQRLTLDAARSVGLDLTFDDLYLQLRPWIMAGGEPVPVQNNESQRAMVAAEVANIKLGENAKNSLKNAAKHNKMQQNIRRRDRETSSRSSLPLCLIRLRREGERLTPSARSLHIPPPPPIPVTRIATPPKQEIRR